MSRRTSSMSSSPALVISSSRAASGSAPGCAYRTTPSRITISVGIEEIPNALASSGSASVSTLPNTASACWPEARSKIGPNIRQGPHHSAQKSTSTMPSLVTSLKLSAVSSTVAMPASSPGEGISLTPAGIGNWPPCSIIPPLASGARSAGQPLEVEHAQAERDEQPGDQPEPDHDRRLSPAEQLEMMLERRHPEDPPASHL